jgi:hypothetical protein
MNTVNANTLKAKSDILSVIEKLGPTKTKIENEEWLDKNLGTDLFGVWMTYDEDEIVGLIIAEAVMSDSGYIAIEWVKNGLGKKELLDKVEDWAKKLGLAKLIKYTNQNPATYIKKFGWSVWQTVIIKEL